jgi:hypothetical protein
VEYIARTVKDLLADTTDCGTLPHIIRHRKTSSLAFYAAFLDGLAKEFFPELPNSFQQFMRTRDWGVIDRAVCSGHKSATRHAELIMDLYRDGLLKNDLKWTEAQIQKHFLGKYMKNGGRHDPLPAS